MQNTKQVKIKEASIESVILDVLNSIGFAWKNEYPQQNVIVRGRRFAKWNEHIHSGFPDVSFLMNGKSFHFEVKRPEIKNRILRNYDKYKNYCGKNKELIRFRNQIRCIERLNKHGSKAAFVSSLKDCLDIIHGI